ncbi:MAG TPA: PRC-barrel domain-containing protein [Thermoleophilaceae bacterium]|nr:PRC-barrel domain-containing protein [Thermoleophilaceae bacterium]
MEIEHIEEWLGQDVVDPDGEKIGKLEDLYYEAGSTVPVAAAVKHGTLGKSLTLVPLERSSITRSYLRVSYEKGALKKAPDVQPATDAPASTVTETGEHFGAVLPAGELESGVRRKQQAEANAAATPSA